MNRYVKLSYIFVKAYTESNKGKAMQAKNLCVLVTENNEEVVSLSMPARAVENLEDLVDPTVRERIEKLGYDLLEIKFRAEKSGYVPQILFEADAGKRKYKVWLQ